MAFVDEKQRKNIVNIKKQKISPNCLDSDCSAPDGGWGWMIVVASGFSQVNIKKTNKLLCYILQKITN